MKVFKAICEKKSFFWKFILENCCHKKTWISIQIRIRIRIQIRIDLKRRIRIRIEINTGTVPKHWIWIFETKYLWIRINAGFIVPYNEYDSCRLSGMVASFGDVKRS